MKVEDTIAGLVQMMAALQLLRPTELRVQLAAAVPPFISAAEATRWHLALSVLEAAERLDDAIVEYQAGV